jgi:hypothetical protein
MTAFILLIISMNSSNVMLAVPMQDKTSCTSERDLIQASMKEPINWRVGCYDLAKQNFVE